ncbi:hypothetical protein HNY73_010904 [Argiope bruennichi]|uniref:Uncharacterized protein n=1 Tax=Argiope bruennichi TaxID=94029 RepID=A0A8T0F3D9_ARGBR|nr:hypothetical protein HNY73_010904 [Argiope bruennichi]
MEGDGCSDDSSNCKSISSNSSRRSSYLGSGNLSEFMREIRQHCVQLALTKEEALLAHNQAKRLKEALDSTSWSPSKRKQLSERLDEAVRQVQITEEKLKNAKPCINRNCEYHDWEKNLCTHIQNLQNRIQILHSTASTFIDTLQQMKENNLEHTSQYLDDYSKLQELQTDAVNLEGYLGEYFIRN